MIMRKQVVRGALIVALLAIICTAFPAPQASALPAAQAAVGQLDTTFGGFGKGGVVSETGLSMYSYPTEQANGMALQPDGKIVTVSQNGPNLVAFRYLPNGQRDTTFSGDGTVEISPPPGIALQPYDVAVQADGKIVVAGRTTLSSTDDSSDFLLVRLTGSGELDLSFGIEGGGIVTTNLSGNHDSAAAVLVQPNGTIVLCGSAQIGDDDDFAVARYLPTGALDTSFSNDGKMTIGFSDYEECNNLALQSNGKLVLVGQILGDSYSGFAVARLNLNGTLDGGFDGDGKVITRFGGTSPWVAAWDLAIQPDGKIVVVGGNYYNDPNGYIARYLPNGALDGSFGSGGKRTIAGDALFDLELQPDGKMVALGSHASSGVSDFAFYRLLANGAPDPSFDEEGIRWQDFGGDAEDGTDLALLPDGRILGFGRSGTSKLILARLWPDGRSFDTGGRQAHGTSFGMSGIAHALAVQPDGKLLVAGETYPLATPLNRDLYLTRFLADGQVDTSFGFLGNAHIPLLPPLNTSPNRVALAIAVQPDGKIVIAGYNGMGTNASGDFLVMRWNSNGTPDVNFDYDGWKLINFPGNGNDYGMALALAPDGKIVVAGTVWTGIIYAWGVARLTKSGQLDPTFGTNGLTLNLSGNNASASAVVVQPDGKIIIGGSYNNNFFIQRLLENGWLDGGYGSNGAGYTATDLGGNDLINALALAPNGWLYAAGFTSQGNVTDFALTQYRPTGILAQCPSGQTCNYWPEGKRFIDFGGSSDVARALALRSDNQLVAVGCANSRMAAVQLSTTDLSPATLKFQSTSVGYSECASAVQFSGPNKSKIVLAGSSSVPHNILLTGIQTTAAAAQLDQTTGVQEPVSQEQTITIKPDPLPAKLEREQPLRLEATASSGLPVEIVSATPEICTVADTAVVGQAEGRCTINVLQAGDAHWKPVRLKLRFRILPDRSR
jgi:uncharacterized delta-60 repeat protein